MTETTATKNNRDRAAKLADEIKANGLLSVAEEDAAYRTEETLIVLALRYLSGATP